MRLELASAAAAAVMTATHKGVLRSFPPCDMHEKCASAFCGDICLF
jgi:hypothetical protein